MRLSASSAANAVAWAVVAGLAALALVLVAVLGPFGLVLLGLATLLVCTRMSLHEDTPTWSTHVLRARMDSPASPEQRAALRADRQAAHASLRFYRLCGGVLLLAGIAGFAWQQLHG